MGDMGELFRAWDQHKKGQRERNLENAFATGTDGWVSYRWLDYPDKVTVISANSCQDWSLINSSAYGVGDTSYHALFNGGAGRCFVLRGRTASGQGTMVNHDGRVQR